MLIPEALDILAARLSTIDGLTVTTDPGAEVVTPMAVVTDGEIDYNESMRRGAAIMAVDVVVYVSTSDHGAGLYEARKYLSGYGDFSIRAALETSLDDALLFKVVVNTGQAGVMTHPTGKTYFAAKFAASTHVPGEIPT